jgi:hypothetical protein
MFDLAPARQRPRLLAFIRAWTLDSEPSHAHLRKRLAQLDSELVIVSDEGAWTFVRECEPMYRDPSEPDVAGANQAFGVAGDALFVIDHRGAVRFEHRPERPITAALTEALDAAAEALQWRDHQSKLERVRWTPREWALKCLVVGCSLTYVTGRPSVDQRRLARGTGPIAKLESREVITPRAESGAPSPQPPRSGDSRSPSSRRL